MDADGDNAAPASGLPGEAHGAAAVGQARQGCAPGAAANGAGPGPHFPLSLSYQVVTQPTLGGAGFPLYASMEPLPPGVPGLYYDMDAGSAAAAPMPSYGGHEAAAARQDATC